jgi:hypothetical protein
MADPRNPIAGHRPDLLFLARLSLVLFLASSAKADPDTPTAAPTVAPTAAPTTAPTDAPSLNYTFTTLNGVEAIGPTSTAGYASTVLADPAISLFSGVQQWVSHDALRIS